MKSYRGRTEREGVHALPVAKEPYRARLQAMTEEELHQNALTDPDNPPLTDDQLARMRRVPNPQEIRQRLGLSQREFARQFQIALGTLRDWEQGARRPDSAAKAYLRVIEKDPDAVRNALRQPAHERDRVPVG
jgi:putative transcriptional regulator